MVKMASGRERLWGIHNGMVTRCTNPKRKDYPRYGGRGISVCEEWSGNGGFQRFYDWAMSNGYNDNLSIDRIDGDGNYSPNNCRWATPSEQCRNRENNRLITFHGETKTLIAWAEQYHIRKDTLRRRLVDYGWPVSAALQTPVKKREGRGRNRNGR